MHDTNQASANLFNQFADRYAEKYFDIEHYNRFYTMFTERIPDNARVLDIACGPGNVSAYILRNRPDLSVAGIDLAPNMIKIAKERVPRGQFYVDDCRHLKRIDGKFEGAVFAFGLSYLSHSDVEQFFSALNRVICSDAILLLTTIAADERCERYEKSSSGDELFIFYRTPDEICQLLTSHGFRIDFCERVLSPPNAPVKTQDIVLIAQRIEAART